jgi:hypothetical protein
MLYKFLDGSGLADYDILRFTHIMLDSDEGLSEDQYDALRCFVYDQIGPTAEMLDLFNHVDATDGRFYIKQQFTPITACKNSNAVV